MVAFVRILTNLAVDGRGLEFLLEFDLEAILVVVVALEQFDPIHMLVKHGLDEDLGDLKPRPGHKDILEPIAFVANGDLVKIQKQSAEEGLEETAEFLEIGAGFLFFGVS